MICVWYPVVNFESLVGSQLHCHLVVLTVALVLSFCGVAVVGAELLASYQDCCCLVEMELFLSFVKQMELI